MDERDPQTPDQEKERTASDVEAHKRVLPGKRVATETDESSEDEQADVEAHRLTTRNVANKREVI